MLELTEALTHHARLVILEMTNAHTDAIDAEKKLVEKFSQQTGYRDYQFGIFERDNLPPLVHKHYQEGVSDAYADSVLLEEAQEMQAEINKLNALYPETHDAEWLYCSKGHDPVLSKAGYTECACCGSLMTAENEKTYHKTLMVLESH